MLWVNQGFLWPFSSSQTGSLPEGIHDFPWTHHVHPFVLRPWEVWSIPSGEINKFVTKLATHMAHTRISLANFNMSPTWNDSGKKKKCEVFQGRPVEFQDHIQFSHIFTGEHDLISLKPTVRRSAWLDARFLKLCPELFLKTRTHQQ